MRKRGRRPWIGVFLWVVVPMAVLAQTASVEFPDDRPGNSESGCPPGTGMGPHNMPSLQGQEVPAFRRYWFAAKLVRSNDNNVMFPCVRVVQPGSLVDLIETVPGPQGRPDPDTGSRQVHQHPCDTGTEITDRVLRDVCVTAVERPDFEAMIEVDGFSPMVCDDAVDPDADPVDSDEKLACCESPTGGQGAVLHVRTLTGAPCHLKIIREAGNPRHFVVEEPEDETPSCDLTGIVSATRGGNTLITDLFPQFVLQVEPALATVNVGVFHTQGGLNPRTCSVLTTGLSALVNADALTACFNGLGLGLNTVTELLPRSLAGFSLVGVDPSFLFANEPVTVITNLTERGVTAISVRAGVNQKIVAETSDPALEAEAPDLPGAATSLGDDRSTIKPRIE